MNRRLPDKDIEMLADKLENMFDLETVELPEEYHYTCFPLCLLDAVFSIGSNYQSTQNVVRRYGDHFDLEPLFGERDSVLHTTSDLLENIKGIGSAAFAETIVENRQRTSSVNGILKAEAVFRCARVFQKHGIETIAGFNARLNENVEREYRGVKGQSSGISLSYLKMLCGDEDTLKADRHVLSFLKEMLGANASTDEAQTVVQMCVSLLKEKKPQNYAALNVRKLDYVIWDYMSRRAPAEQTGESHCHLL